jgi:amino acid adenylation domain-containing protein
MEDLLKRLRAQDIVISLENSDLKVKFNGPGLPADLLKELKENKAEIVKYLCSLQSDGGEVSIPKAGLQDSYGLSSSQSRVYMLCQFEEANPAYNMPGAYVFEGELRPGALESAFRFLIGRHEILRTVFKEDDSGEIRQVVLPAGQWNFELEGRDLRLFPDREEKLKQEVQAALSRPFDLKAPLLLRACLYRIADDKWVCTYVMHHIIGDGWSLDILVHELSECYSAFVKGETPALKALRIQYKDYAEWQNRQLTTPAMRAHRSYWLQQLEGELPTLALQGDKSRPAVKTYRGGMAARRWEGGIAKRTKAFCQQQDATLFMGLLTAVATLLYRYSGQQDLIIGTPVAGRDHLDLEDQLGLYLNTLPLRCRIRAADDFRGLLAEVRRLTMAAFEHRVYPFEELVNELRPNRDMSRSPLFDVMLTLQNANIRSAAMQWKSGDLSVSEYGSREYRVSKLDLTFDFAEVGDGLQATLEYNNDIYDQRTAEHLLALLHRLLEAGLANPAVPVGQLDYLSEAEKQELIYQFNETRADFPADKTFIGLFGEQAMQRPDFPALKADGRELTYRELNERCSRLGWYLHNEYGIGPDDPVLLCLDRSASLLVGVMGTLKADGVYVPMDPAAPAERIRHALQDTGARVLLTDPAHAERMATIAEGLPVAIEIIDAGGCYASLSADYSTANQGRHAGSRGMMYIMYTSGTTGMPKGVMVEQGAYLNLLMYYRTTFFKQGEPINTFSVTNYIFDIWGLEYGLPLISGGFIELSGSDFDDLDTGGYSFIQMTPGLLSARYEAIRFTHPGLKLFVGGEALSGSLLKKVLQHELACVVNVYGPTETTIWSLNQVNTGDRFNLNIGRPIANTTAYILDDNQSLAPVGAVGELCIGGAGLARGYLNNPELTAIKFIADPYRSGQRIYRTGDLARWLPDGTVAFIGRKDDQVKIQGHRIEPGEIEAVLAGHEQIGSVAVAARINAAGEKELVAYLTGADALQTADLRTFLDARLPAYMIPARFIRLPALPLTPNGKLDRKKLPDPEGLELGTGIAYVSPRNKIEEQLVVIWQELLGKDKIGVKDNFFDLGGNSMKLLKMVALIRKTFGQKLSIAIAFRYPNIRSLSEYLAAGGQLAGGESNQSIAAAVEVMDETLSLLKENLNEA